MINFDYYITVFDGKKITTEKDFEKFLKKATLYVDSVTSQKGSEKEIAEGICALCDILSDYEKHENIRSESADGVSISYTAQNIEKLMYNTLKLYLPKRLLYRGL